MKVLLLSDTHMYNDVFEAITRRYPAMDLYIHCGDSSLKMNDERLQIYDVVKGNHDDDLNIPADIIITTNYKKRILVTHGHKYGVHFSYDHLIAYMQKHEIDICFHGHTHVPNVEEVNGKLFINPGSTMMNRGDYGYGTYAIVDIKEDITVDFFDSRTFEHYSLAEIKDKGKEILAAFKKMKR